jgi:hypothetical protein
MWCLQGSREVLGSALLEHDRDRAVVDQLDRHALAEDTRLDPDAELPQRLAEGFVERFGLLGLRRLAKARPVALRRVLMSSAVNRTMKETRCDSTATSE